MVIQRQQTPRYPSTISSFSPISSGTTLDALGPAPKGIRDFSTFSGLGSTRDARPPISSMVWTPSQMISCIGDNPSQPADTSSFGPFLLEGDELIEVDKIKSKKKKRLFVRVVRKAGSFASKKLGIKKSAPKTPVVQQAAANAVVSPHVAAVVEAWKSASLSKTSLVAVEGSPQSWHSPPTQSAAAEETTLMIEVRSPGGSKQKEHPLARVQFARMFKHATLFLPHTALIGFAAFFAPQRLSELAFSRFPGYSQRPANPTGVFVHHAHTLPYQCGLAVGVFSVVLWALFKMHPGFAVLALSVAYTLTHAAWKDYDTSADAGRAFLGVDDRDTIYWILRGYVLGELACSFDDFTRWFKEDKEVEDGQEDEELESFEWNWGGNPGKDGPLNYLIRLKDRPQETMRIVIEAPQTD